RHQGILARLPTTTTLKSAPGPRWISWLTKRKRGRNRMKKLLSVLVFFSLLLFILPGAALGLESIPPEMYGYETEEAPADKDTELPGDPGEVAESPGGELVDDQGEEQAEEEGEEVAGEQVHEPAEEGREEVAEDQMEEPAAEEPRMAGESGPA